MKLESVAQFTPLLQKDVPVETDLVQKAPFGLSAIAQQRVDLLALWKQEGYSAVVAHMGATAVSEGTLYRWQKMLSDAEGDITALNPAFKEPVLSVHENLTEIVDELIPISEYISVVIHPETGKEIKIIDSKKLKELVSRHIQYKSQSIPNQKILEELYRRHQSDVGITKGQLAMEDYTERPVFYVPASATEATKISFIVDDTSHLTLFDIANNVTKSNQELLYPTTDGSKLSYLEAQVAYTLFHPSRAFAVREGTILTVKNPDYNPQNKNTSEKRVPITTKILRRYGLRVLQQSRAKNAVRASIQENIESKCPNLFANGAIQKSDFRELSFTAEGEVIEDFSPSKISSSGCVTIHGVDHWIGRPYAGYFAIPFNGTKAIIVEQNDSKQVIRGMFTLTSKDDVSSVYRNENTGNTNYRANAEKTNVQSIAYSRFSDRESGTVLNAQQQREAEVTIAFKISQLITLAQQANQLVHEELHDVTESSGSRIRKAILSDVERLISSVTSAQDASELNTLLDSYTDEARVFVAMLTKIGAERMLSNPLEHSNSTQLTEEYREQMRRVMYDNYRREYPGEEKKEFRNAVMAGFEKALTSPNSDFYLLRDNDTVVSFNRFDTHINPETGKKILYFGSFNANSKYRGVGGFMIERTIQEKLQQCDAMQAHCDPESDISKKYIEDGFIATNTETVAGKFSFEIWRSKDSNAQLQTKNMTKEALVAIAHKTVSVEDDYFVREVEPNDRFLELDSGLAYLLTRYFTMGGKTYAAFEINPALSNTFTR